VNVGLNDDGVLGPIPPGAQPERIAVYDKPFDGTRESEHPSHFCKGLLNLACRVDDFDTPTTPGSVGLQNPGE
jgi:hypothetical protein